MTAILTAAGYEQTKEKLANLEERMARLDGIPSLSLTHKAEVCRSYDEMIGQYRREIKLYEATHSENATK